MKIILILIALMNICMAGTLDEIVLMSEDFPPYNYQENNIPKGSSIEVIKYLIDKTKSQKKLSEITFYPWARSYSILLNEKNTALFAMTKTKDRASKFKWVGPISKAQNVVLGLPETKIQNQFKENSFCVIQNDAGEQLLFSKLKINKRNVSYTQNIQACINMVLAKRVDFFAYDLNVTKWYLKKNGKSADTFKNFFLLESGEHYIAFNSQTDEKIIKELQKYLKEFK